MTKIRFLPFTLVLVAIPGFGQGDIAGEWAPGRGLGVRGAANLPHALEVVTDPEGITITTVVADSTYLGSPFGCLAR